MKEAIRFCDALGVERPGGRGKPLIFHYATLSSSNRSLWKRRSLLCHPERSRGICSSADLSWKCFSTALRSQLSSREPVTFSIFWCFLHIQPAVFQTPDKAVILSEALRRSIANRRPYSAESKDPGDACWQMLLGAFRPQTTRKIKSHKLRA